MKKVIASFCLVMGSIVTHLYALPLVDLDRRHVLVAELSSPDPKVRDNAAAEIRGTCKEVPESKWQPLLKAINTGEDKADVLKLLKPLHVELVPTISGGGYQVECYRLDDDWILKCWYQDGTDRLGDKQLLLDIKRIWVDCPEHYTGKWVEYFANGQKSAETNCKDGQGEGDQIRYYPSGRVWFIDHYKGGEAVGTSMWYDEKGIIDRTDEWFGEYCYVFWYHEKTEPTSLGEIDWKAQTLPAAFKRVITPAAEFISDSSGWQRIEKGSTWSGKTSSTASIEACLVGDFEHPPSGVGDNWFYVVGKNLWVNPAKMEEVAAAKFANPENE
jgi:hypothetical protein